MQYQTCRHVKEDGIYCGSPALRDNKYCHYHLQQRGRRLRRARALRDNVPYQIDIQSLDNPYAVRTAITEVAQALAAGQLDHAVAGKILYAIQQASSQNKLIAQIEAAQAQALEKAQEQGHSPAVTRPEEDPDFAKRFDIPPGSDIDAETEVVLKKAQTEVEFRQARSVPMPPPGVRPGSAHYDLYRDQAIQDLRTHIEVLQSNLREYWVLRNQMADQYRKEAQSANIQNAVAKTA
jgi:hypothetical protein